MVDLESRIRRLEHREQIRDLAVRYALAFDNRDLSTLRALFTPDCVIRTLAGEIKGDGLEGVMSHLSRALDRLGPSYHVVHGHLIDVADGDSEQATGVVTAHAESMRPEGQMIIAMRYHDSYRRVGDVWLFQERMQTFLYLVDINEYAGILSSHLRVRPSRDDHRAADWPPVSP